MKLKTRILIFSAISLVAILSALFYYHNRVQTGSNTSPQAQVRGEESPEAVDSQQIHFSKSLLLQEGSYSVDGGELHPFSCPPEGAQFATIQWKENEVGTLFCKDEYLGGVKLKYKGKNGEDAVIDLAQRDGDAGDSWDFRSLILRNPDDSISIEQLSFSTSQDPAADNSQFECNSTKSSFVWDAVARGFVNAQFSGAMKEELFNPPTTLSDSCKDSNGKWKETNTEN